MFGRRKNWGAFHAAAAMALLLAGSGAAMGDAHGPDAWRVVDVAADDALNARMGPGTSYGVIGQFSHDARGLQQVTCVPLVTAAHYFEMTEAERGALPPRWCLMRSADMTAPGAVQGWVAQRYLAEDHVEEIPTALAGEDPLVAAERLVQQLYQDHLHALHNQGISPLASTRAEDFFTAPLAAAILRDGLQADPLFDAQDSDITDLQVALDDEEAMFRGMITVNADFRNFGYPRRAVVRLRIEEKGPRVIRIEHEAWSFE